MNLTRITFARTLAPRLDPSGYYMTQPTVPDHSTCATHPARVVIGLGRRCREPPAGQRVSKLRRVCIRR